MSIKFLVLGGGGVFWVWGGGGSADFIFTGARIFLKFCKTPQLQLHKINNFNFASCECILTRIPGKIGLVHLHQGKNCLRSKTSNCVS